MPDDADPAEYLGWCGSCRMERLSRLAAEEEEALWKRQIGAWGTPMSGRPWGGHAASVATE